MVRLSKRAREAPPPNIRSRMLAHRESRLDDESPSPAPATAVISPPPPCPDAAAAAAARRCLLAPDAADAAADDEAAAVAADEASGGTTRGGCIDTPRLPLLSASRACLSSEDSPSTVASSLATFSSPAATRPSSPPKAARVSSCFEMRSKSTASRSNIRPVVLSSSSLTASIPPEDDGVNKSVGEASSSSLTVWSTTPPSLACSCATSSNASDRIALIVSAIIAPSPLLTPSPTS
mmetsp:Transcript_18959/g.37542  ORF Transcript_18959/g.37542 Transcript_18959/m.37542 type:complete len:236 (+) Transcript_18959:1-708(+)